MPENRIRIAPNTVAYADGEKHQLVMEFAIPGAPTDTIDSKGRRVCLSTGFGLAGET
jgi:hypothetical protein